MAPEGSGLTVVNHSPVKPMENCNKLNTPYCLKKPYELYNFKTMPRSDNKLGSLRFLQQNAQCKDLEMPLHEYISHAMNADFSVEYSVVV